MRGAWIVAWNDLGMLFRSKQYWFLLLVLPALTIYLVGLAAQGIAQTVPDRITVDVLDRDESAASHAFVAALAETNETLLVCPAGDDPTDGCALAGAELSPEVARRRLADEVAVATITIPEGFASAVEAGDAVELVFEPGASPVAAEIAFAAVQNVVARLGGPIVAARLGAQFAESLGLAVDADDLAARRAEAEASWGPPPPVQMTVETTQPARQQVLGAQLLENGFRLSTPSIAAMFVMISVMGLTQSLADERMMGVLLRMGMMPLSKVQFLGGKLLSTFLMGVFQFGVLLAFGELLGVGFASAPLATALVVAAYVLAVSALALALATLVRAPDQASAITTATWLILIPLGGGWWPLALVPGWMQTVGHLSPVAWCLDALNELVFYQGTVADVLLPVGVLLLFAAVFCAFGVWRLDYAAPGTGSGPRMLPFLGIQGEGED
jgi:ABC-2 type transport system permease protein